MVWVASTPAMAVPSMVMDEALALFVWLPSMLAPKIWV